MKHQPVPDWVFQNVMQITPAWLKEQGFCGVFADLDNTLTGYAGMAPDADVLGWMESLSRSGIALTILSNGKERRVSGFCTPLQLPYTARCGKPRPHTLRQTMEKTGLSPAQVLMVGDQIFTDILAAKRAGMRAALVEPVTSNLFFALRRLAEAPWIRAARKNQG